MKYMGSKNRIANDILPIILKDRKEGQWYVEPFCGGLGTFDKVAGGNKIANDKNKYLIAMWNGLKEDRERPKQISKELYSRARTEFKNNTNIEFDDFMIGWIGWMASFNGRFFDGGYSGCSGKRDYIDEQIRNTEKQIPLLSKSIFTNFEYFDLEIPPESIIYCFDKDSECLTKEGWKNVKDITLDDYCFSREPNTRKLEWVKVDKLVSYHYNGKMYKYEGKNIDIMTTPNHRLFINKPKTRNKVYNDEFIEADKAFNSNFRFVSANGVWDGNKDSTINICNTVFNKKDFAYLLGIFITDGCVNKQGIITISQSKPNIIDKIKACLQILKIPVSIYDNNRDDVKIFYIPRKYLPFFKQFYLKENRKIPVEFKEASVDVLNALMEGIIDGDGSENRRIILGSKSLVDDIQEICYKIGLSSNYQIIKPKSSYLKSEDRYINATKEHYVISINHKPYLSHFHKNESYVDYNDMVYCFELEKWHTVLIRRNGKIIWNGQCDIPYKGTKQYLTSRDFNHTDFWEWARKMTKSGHTVFISEYQAPEDFECVWEKKITNTMSLDKTYKPTEKLFIYKGDDKK